MPQSKVIIKAVALFVGIMHIAGVAGYMAGEFANASNIIPTVISALVAVLLGWWIITAKSDHVGPSVLSGLGAVVFCLTLLVVMSWTSKDVQKREVNAFLNELNLRNDLHQEHLKWCSELEFRINDDRKKVGLPPLSSEIVCGYPFVPGQSVQSRGTDETKE